MLFRFRIAPPDGTIRVVILGTLLGTAEKDGRRVFEIGYYGRIDDLTAFLQLAVPQSLRGTLGGGRNSNVP